MPRPPIVTSVASPSRAAIPRLLLQADGLVVGVGGSVLLLRARLLASALGLTGAWPLAALGALCVPYGTWLCWAATRVSGVRLHRLIGAIAVANTAWVIASAALLRGDTPARTAPGRWVVATQAVVVAVFAAAEAFARRWVA